MKVRFIRKKFDICVAPKQDIAMKNILVPSDFSDNARDALNYAVNVADQCGSRLHLLNVSHVVSRTTDMLNSAMMVRRMVEQAEREFAELKAELIRDMQEKGKHVPHIEYVTMEGDVVETIVDAAKEVEADLIIMGTQGASGLREVVMGSNTANVIRQTSCPVLSVPKDLEYKSIERITFATDLLEDDSAILKQLVAFAKHFDARIQILTVWDEHMKKELRDLDELQDRLVRNISYPNISFHIVKEADILEGINGFTLSHETDVIALLTRGRNFFERIFSPSLTRKFSMHSEVPVLAFHK